MSDKVYVLTKQEESKFDWKNYQRKFPTIRLIIALLEILLVVVFILIRFDCVYTIPGGTLPDGTILFYNIDEANNVVPFVVDQLATDGKVVLNVFYNATPSLGSFGHKLIIAVAHYVEFINSLFINKIFPVEKALTIEILLIIVATILIIVFTFAIGGTCAPLIRKNSAVKRAKKARTEFIEKLKLEGYSVIDEEVSSEEIDDNIFEEEKISSSNEKDLINEIKEEKINEEINNKVYYTENIESEDISYAPLGSDKENEVLNKPIVYKSSRKANNEVKIDNNDIVFAPITSEETPLKTDEKNEAIENKNDIYQNEDMISESSNQNQVNTNLEGENNIEEKSNNEEPLPIINETKKDIKPIDVDDKDGKTIDYVINTTDASKLSMKEDEFKSPEKPIKQPRRSALVRTPLARTKNVNKSNQSIKKSDINKPTKPIELKPVEEKEDETKVNENISKVKATTSTKETPSVKKSKNPIEKKQAIENYEEGNKPEKPIIKKEDDIKVDGKSPESTQKTVKKNYHVSLRASDGKWQVKFAKGQRAIKLFDTQAQAIDYAKVLAQSQKGTVTIHKVDGKIRKQDYSKK